MSYPGPCCICGLKNYPLSMGGSTICPSCDILRARAQTRAHIARELRRSPRVGEAFELEVARALHQYGAQQYEAGRVAGVEAAADRARRGSDVIRGWIKPDSSDERTDALLYSALREGQEIELVIRSLLVYLS